MTCVGPTMDVGLMSVGNVICMWYMGYACGTWGMHVVHGSKPLTLPARMPGTTTWIPSASRPDIFRVQVPKPAGGA